MLRRVLRALADVKGPVSLPELAAHLGLDEAILTAMLDDLVRLGYLCDALKGGPAACVECRGCAGCPPGVGDRRVLQLSAAGKRAAG
ncbi:MAG: helix-turn-helix domain-containing protein [Chloroflexi bacterium]|nr:helix-turn-helix domain-containing protein [Chloroflexota bacterium]